MNHELYDTAERHDNAILDTSLSAIIELEVHENVEKAHHYDIEHEVLGALLHGRKAIAWQSHSQSTFFRTCELKRV